MKRVFLSLPMSGRTDVEIEKQIEEMKRWILKSKYYDDEAIIFVHNLECNPQGYGIVDDYEEHGINYRCVPAECRQEPLLYLASAIKQMAYVDGVFFGNGWAKARGCCVERNVAISYHIPVVNCSSLVHLKKLKQMRDAYEESKKVRKEKHYE